MRILFLDLDGTVRTSKGPTPFVNAPEDVAVYPEAATQIIRFCDSGWYFAFVSNQGGIGEGHVTAGAVWAAVGETKRQLEKRNVPMHRLIHTGVCPHRVNAGCICRKPRPGMVAQIVMVVQAELGVQVNMDACLFVGDREEDRRCAEACGIPFVSAMDWREGQVILNPNGGAVRSVKCVGMEPMA